MTYIAAANAAQVTLFHRRSSVLFKVFRLVVVVPLCFHVFTQSLKSRVNTCLGPAFDNFCAREALCAHPRCFVSSPNRLTFSCTLFFGSLVRGGYLEYDQDVL